MIGADEMKSGRHKMAKVSYKVESDADDWHISQGTDPDAMDLLFSHDHTEFEFDDLAPGFYIAQIAIRGEDSKTGRLTISRPKYADKIINVSIDPGTGGGINLRGFRVVEE